MRHHRDQPGRERFEHFSTRLFSDQGEESSFEGGTAISRRKVLVGSSSAILTAATTTINPQSAWSALISADSTELGVGLLESRVTENILSPPPYGMEGTDVFYPSWFNGAWNVRSETVSIEAPCGVALFGGNATYNAALADVGNVLQYQSRFLKDPYGNNPNKVIADREYNVKSIAKVAMGENSVVDVSMATPNKFSCLLAPKGAPSMLSVDLLVLNRRAEDMTDENRFDCAEVVREIASPVDSPKARLSPILKEIETTSLYTYDPVKDIVTCQQRSAAFLLPSNENPMAMKMWQASRGRAIDVRFYKVTYTRA